VSALASGPGGFGLNWKSEDTVDDGGYRDAFEASAHDVQCVLGGKQQDATGTWHGEAAQTWDAGGDRDGEVQRQERLAALRLAAAQAEGFLIDPSFVAIVPLGGRHVQYFWRLLDGLSIPYATLLDLDLGRKGGGWGRIKTAIVELIENGYSREKLLETEGGKQADLDKMHTWKTDKNLAGWVTFLRRYDVFFSDPLDLDMAMLKAFPTAYEAIIPKGGGPSAKATPRNRRIGSRRDDRRGFPTRAALHIMGS
jgi:hypothetical protein